MRGEKGKGRELLENVDTYMREGPGKRFTEPRLLFILRQGPAHGYELIRRMGEVPLPGPLPDTGAVYRALRRMEQEGLVTSSWAETERGPRRKVYRITPGGKKRLNIWVEAIKGRVELLLRFLELCGDGDRGKARRSG